MTECSRDEKKNRNFCVCALEREENVKKIILSNIISLALSPARFSFFSLSLFLVFYFPFAMALKKTAHTYTFEAHLRIFGSSSSHVGRM
jgi:hypothetical protein